MRKLKIVALALAAAQLGACANLAGPAASSSTMSRDAQRLARDEIGRAKSADMAPQGFTEHTEGHFVDFDVRPSHPFEGDVHLQVSEAPMGPVLVELARRTGYEITFHEHIDLRRPVTINLSGISGKHAVRQVAQAVGYVAVVDEPTRTITIADQATYVFKLPIQLLNSAGGSYTAGGNPMASGSSSGGGNPATGISAQFNIKGEVKGATGKGFLEQVKTVAGSGAVVALNEESGMLTVRGGAQTLSRVARFVSNQVNEASAQVWVETTVIEVTLANDFAVGIDWGRIFNTSNGLTASIRGAEQVAGGAAPLSVAYTTANSRTVVDALMKHSQVKIISNPTVMMTNHVPSAIFQGRADPYLPSITTTTTGTTGTTSTSAKAEFATSGLMLSAVADILDERRVQMTLMPVLTRVEGFEELNAGDSILRVPVQSSSSTTLRVTAEAGRTMIIGGIRSTTGGGNAALGYLGNNAKATELVIMVRAKVMPVNVADPIVAELL